MSFKQLTEFHAVISDYVHALAMNEKDEALPVFWVIGFQSLKTGFEQRAHYLFRGSRAPDGDIALLVLDGDCVPVGEESVHDPSDNVLFGVSGHAASVADDDDEAQARRAA